MNRLIAAALLLSAATVLAQESKSYGKTYRLKVKVGGAVRKAAFFVPKNVKRNEVLPLLVAIPDTKGKAYLELGQWQQPAYEDRFAVFSVDIVTSSVRGWHPSEQLEMRSDMDAVIDGLEIAFEKAREIGVEIDRSAMVITGHSGGTYLTLWLGIRRPDLFLGICGRSCVFHKDTVKFGKLDKVPPNFDQEILLYRGELDHPRTSAQTEEAAKVLKKAGYKNVAYRVVPKMQHESKPEVCLAWFAVLLKRTAKGRAESRKIAKELEPILPQLEAGKASAVGKLAKLVERERKGGFPGGASEAMAGIMKQAQQLWADAENLEADSHFVEAVAAFKKLEKGYMPLELAKQARKRKAKIIKSDDFKADEMLLKGLAMIEKGSEEKGGDLLAKLIERYPDTAAADRAQQVLEGG